MYLKLFDYCKYINRDENKSLTSNQFSLKNHFPPLLGELFCGGKKLKVENDHK